MRKKVVSLVVSAGMLIGLVPNSVMADTAFQSEGPVPAEQTEEEKTVEAAEKAALAFATLPAEKEIIAIVAGAERRKLIMETVNKKHGMNTAAGAMICSVAIDRMQRLG